MRDRRQLPRCRIGRTFAAGENNDQHSPAQDPPYRSLIFSCLALLCSSAAFADPAEIPASEMPSKPPEPSGPVAGLPPPQPQSGPSVDSAKIAKDAEKRAKQCQKLLAKQDKALKLDDEAAAVLLGQCKAGAIAPVAGGGPVMLSATNCPWSRAVLPMMRRRIWSSVRRFT